MYPIAANRLGQEGDAPAREWQAMSGCACSAGCACAAPAGGAHHHFNFTVTFPSIIVDPLTKTWFIERLVGLNTIAMRCILE